MSPSCPVGQQVQGFLHELDRQVHAAFMSELASITVAGVLARVHADDVAPVATAMPRSVVA